MGTEQITPINVPSNYLKASIKNAKNKLKDSFIDINEQLQDRFPYLAPELLFETGNPTPSSDVYSICVMLKVALKTVLLTDWKRWEDLTELVQMGTHTDATCRPKLANI